MYVTFNLLLALFVCVLLVAVVLGWVADIKRLRQRMSEARRNGRWRETTTGNRVPFSQSARSARFASRIHAHRASRASNGSSPSSPACPSTETLEEVRHREILGLQETTPHTVREAYRKLMLLHHPDRVLGRGPEAERNAEEMAKQVNQAYRYFRRRLDF